MREREGSAAVSTNAFGGRTSVNPTLAPAQIEMLRSLGQEREARVGDVLYRVGDAIYPFMAILDGEVLILDAGGQEIIRYGPAGFLGELNLLTGQTVLVTAVVTRPLRYIAVDREQMRTLLFDDGPLSEVVLGALMERRELLQELDGVGLEIVGPRSSEETMRILGFARSNLVPHNGRTLLRPEAGLPSSASPAVRSSRDHPRDSSRGRWD